MDDAEYINDRMERFANSSNSQSDVKSILVEDMGELELRAFALGVRAGKHWAASHLMMKLSSIGREIAEDMDPYIKR
jgi:hypothetical protein